MNKSISDQIDEAYEEIVQLHDTLYDNVDFDVKPIDIPLDRSTTYFMTQMTQEEFEKISKKGKPISFELNRIYNK